MNKWIVSIEYHFGEKIYIVNRINDNKQETIGTFDDELRAQEFANILNEMEKLKCPQ